MAFKMKYKDLQEVVDQLKSAVKAHGKQAEIIEEHIDEMKDSPMKKYKSDAQRKAIYASKAESAMKKKKGLWDNIHAKRKRIKAGSGEKMRKPGSEGAPSAQDLKDSQ
jgi:hypothetical protein|tara:strand:- start:43 stop:366 length:324 start_codon:yes stop_codon:yes gene_type:complete